MTLETVPFVMYPHAYSTDAKWWAEHAQHRFRIDGLHIDAADDSFWVTRSRAWLDEWRFWVARQGGSTAVPYIQYRWDTSTDIPARIPDGAIATVPRAQIAADVARVRDNGFAFGVTETLPARLIAAVMERRQKLPAGHWPVLYCNAAPASGDSPGSVTAYKVVLDPWQMVDLAVEHCLHVCDLIGVRAIQLTVKRAVMETIMQPDGKLGIHHRLAGVERRPGLPEGHVLSVPPWEPGHYESAYQRFIGALREAQIDVVKLELPGAGGTGDWLGPDLAAWVREPAVPWEVVGTPGAALTL
ncbi:MAG: hypothetical protein ACE5FA_01100 [Dehalococcoidia bacterium]